MKNRSLYLITFIYLSWASSSWADNFQNLPKLTVKGEASIFKPADQMEVTLGVVTKGANSSQALNENHQYMYQIVNNLQTLGLDETDYKTGRFHIQPIYQKPPKGSNEDKQTIISYYEVSNAIQIKTQKMALVDKIIAEAVRGGANQVDQVNFSLNNPQAYRAEAIKMATENALADAHSLANAAGVKVKRILDLSLDHWQQFASPMQLSQRNKQLNDQNDKLTQDVLEPGKAEIHATVNVVFEIDQSY